MSTSRILPSVKANLDRHFRQCCCYVARSALITCLAILPYRGLFCGQGEGRRNDSLPDFGDLRRFGRIWQAEDSGMLH